MKKVFGKINEAGTMLVEAMAMLGLIAMVTPVLYKKAAERTTELQDINASNQLRILADAMDSYIKDNFARINEGETIQNSCHEGSVDYSGFTDASSVSFDISHLCEYLPYGFLKDGKTQESKLFSNVDPSFKVVLRKTTGTEKDEEGKDIVISETITGFLTAVPNEGNEFPSNRVSRIATMVGSNGGYVEEDGRIMGAQGIWSLSGDDELGLNLNPKTFVVSSLQPISSQGLANEDVLHRKTERQNDYVLNSMETDLFMGFNNKNHNIRLVNQIIMKPQPDWMVGGPENDFMKNSLDDTPQPELGEYKPDLDYTLYIGDKGGAYMEGNMAALDSLFTVRSEAGTDGGIKYYGTNTENVENPEDPANPTTQTTKGGAVLSITTSKLEYGNIGDAAGALLTVDKDNSSMTFESKTENGAAEGTPPTFSSQKLVDATPSRVNIIDGALSVRNPGVADDTGSKYGDYDTNPWPKQNAAPAVIIGGGEVHDGSYTTYYYDTNGKPVIEGGELKEDTDNTTGEHALTVNGPAFVKDSLKTAKLKAYNVDAARLRGGTSIDHFDDATVDEKFYFVTKQRKLNETADEGMMLVGPYKYGDAEEIRHRIQVSEYEEALSDGASFVYPGVTVDHEKGINLISNSDVAGDPDVGSLMLEYDESDADNPYHKTTVLREPTAGQVSIGAHNAVSLSTIATDGTYINNGVVSLQDDMLRLYNNVDEIGEIGYVDSYTDYARFVSRSSDNVHHNNLYSREVVGTEGLFGLGDMDFVVTEDVLESDGSVEVARPVMDIKANRGAFYTSSKFSGGFAIYDHDVSLTPTTDASTGEVTVPADYTKDGTKGNPALYVDKSDFQILATKSAATKGINKGDIILQVDNNSDEGVIADDENRGSVYIRKGAINIAGKDFTGVAADYERLTNADIGKDYVATDAGDASAQGYIAADRFIAHTKVQTKALSASNDKLSGNTIYGVNSKGSTGVAVVPYDRFEINPAYTSVMHDIKLTTRGGARLSDILPDFINKGIYLVDNTYSEKETWVGAIPGNLKQVDNPTSESFTSAYLGFVPTPTCPQGYSKVITINPSGWAMAQAGTPVTATSKGADGTTVNYVDIATHNNPYLYWYTPDGVERSKLADAEPVTPLTFQKSTWLRAMVMPLCKGKLGGDEAAFQVDGKCTGAASSFKGWGTVMGFIYPKIYYENFIEGKVANVDASGKGHANVSNKEDADDDMVYWNLYPVKYKQIEAYVTVYCYFNRRLTVNPDGSGGSVWNTEMVDTGYDQMNNQRDYWDKKDTEYSRRLNDPNLKYTDPW